MSRAALRGIIAGTILAFCLMMRALAQDAAYEPVFKAANPHLRSARSYLRTGNGDLALIELDGFASAWEPLADDPAVAFITASMADASRFAEAGKLEKAEAAVYGARSALRARHRELRSAFFEDCIWEANLLGDPLWAYIKSPPGFETAGPLQEAAAYRAAISACNLAAPAAIAADPEFRRLVDGTLLSLDQAAKAIKEKDAATLHRYLIEIISFDRLLYFRFG
jgi:hypothetical protein